MSWVAQTQSHPAGSPELLDAIDALDAEGANAGQLAALKEAAKGVLKAEVIVANGRPLVVQLSGHRGTEGINHVQLWITHQEGTEGPDA